jgi:hypothetical protein
MPAFRLLLVSVALLFSTSVIGHEDAEQTCEPPVRPFDDHNDQEWYRFLDQTDAFRACIGEMTRRHEQAVAEHQAHANASVQAWNDFVQKHLNVPEDFPLPNEHTQVERRHF